jgi:hypothetical protein
MSENVKLLRHMQWWILEMVAEEMAAGNTGLPEAPELDVDDARAVTLWLRHCSEAIAPKDGVIRPVSLDAW